jgi:hypothetical protein
MGMQSSAHSTPHQAWKLIKEAVQVRSVGIMKVEVAFG